MIKSITISWVTSMACNCFIISFSILRKRISFILLQKNLLCFPVTCKSNLYFHQYKHICTCVWTHCCNSSLFNLTGNMLILQGDEWGWVLQFWLPWFAPMWEKQSPNWISFCALLCEDSRSRVCCCTCVYVCLNEGWGREWSTSPGHCKCPWQAP